MQPPTVPAITDSDYEYICRMVYARSRICLGPDKRTLVVSRLAKRIRQLSMADCSEYCHHLRSSASEDEWRCLIDRISTNHTLFFREVKHFDFLRTEVLPAWRASASRAPEPLRVWSAACSSGEEPYSLAILLDDNLAPAETGAWQIEASDISTRVLATAQEGIYPQERLKGIPEASLRRHFQRGSGQREGLYRIKPRLREAVGFHHLNLLEGEYPFNRPFHVIFCRNVMIYFDRATQEELVGRLQQRLAPGGYLMVGHSETLSGLRHPLKSVQPAIYLKPR